MKRIAYLLAALAVIVGGVLALNARANGSSSQVASPIYGVTIPQGYRDWPMISVAHVGGDIDDLRVKLGNDIAMKAFREGTVPFPDGTIIVRLAYKQLKSPDTDLIQTAPGKETPPLLTTVLNESFVAGPPTNIEIMVKDSKRYSSTGGWGFAQFTGGKPDSEQLHKTCFSCHAPAKDRDYVFTRYAP